MLTAARNEMLTRVGAGTPMGELLRRYWQPIAGASELHANPIKPVRIMGEDLVLYRDHRGRYRPHRPALSTPARRFGLRVGGGNRYPLQLPWLVDGRELAAVWSNLTRTLPVPSHHALAATRKPIRSRSALVSSLRILARKPAPELPVWEPFTWPNGFREIVLADVPCNWFQCQENSIDPVHFEWMHDNWGSRQTRQ